MIQFAFQTDQISHVFDPSKVHQKTRILSTYVAGVDIASASGRLWVDIGWTLGRHWVDIGIQIGILLDTDGGASRSEAIRIGLCWIQIGFPRFVLETDGGAPRGTPRHTHRTPAP